MGTIVVPVVFKVLAIKMTFKGCHRDDFIDYLIHSHPTGHGAPAPVLGNTSGSLGWKKR